MVTSYITPTDSVVEGGDLENLFHDIIVGITGITSDLVRPGWQTEPSNIPDASTLWVSFRFEDESSDTYPYISNAGVLHRHEIFSCVCSFYGSGTKNNAKTYAKILRDGLSIQQNREALVEAGIGLIDVTAPVPMPLLIKTNWTYRVETRVRVRREIVRTYVTGTVESVTGGMKIQTNGALIERSIDVEEET